jgi:hypothetical protein
MLLGMNWDVLPFGSSAATMRPRAKKTEEEVSVQMLTEVAPRNRSSARAAGKSE